MQVLPRHGVNRGQGVERPRLRRLAFADGQRLVVGMRRDATRARRGDQGAQPRPGLGPCQVAQPAQRLAVVEVGDVRARQLGVLIDRGVARMQAER